MHLTNNIRDVIQRAMLVHRFEADQAARDEEKYAIARNAYATLYSAKLRKRMYELPRGWLPQHSEIEVCIAGQRHRLPFSDECTEIRRFKDVDTDWAYGKVTLEASHRVANALSKWLGRRERLRKMEREYAAEIQAALRPIRTLNQLKKRWPEAMAFVPEDIASQANVPAIPMKALNRKLGLTA